MEKSFGCEDLLTYQSLNWGLRHEDQLSIVNQFKKAVTMIFKRKSVVQGMPRMSHLSDAISSLQQIEEISPSVLMKRYYNNKEDVVEEEESSSSLLSKSMFDSLPSSSSEVKLRKAASEIMVSRNSSNVSTPSPLNNGRYMKKKKNHWTMEQNNKDNYMHEYKMNNDKSFESDFLSDVSSEKL